MAKDNIIFLDVDGVLNYSQFFKSKKYKKLSKKLNCDPSSMINRRNLFWIGLLCRLTDAKVVLTSTWRYYWNNDTNTPDTRILRTAELLADYGIELHSRTRTGEINIQNKYEFNEDKIEKWCAKDKAKGLEDLSNRDFVLKYCRGTQIMDWIERNNFTGKYIIIDDDYQDIEFYKDFENKLIVPSYYKYFGGFRFIHLVKALWRFWKQ